VRLWLSQWNSHAEIASSLVRVVGENRCSDFLRVMKNTTHRREQLARLRSGELEI
jgi:hypothetical protein